MAVRYSVARQMLHHAAARRHVKDLAAAADAKEGQIRGQRPARQRQLQFIALEIDALRLGPCQRLVKVARMHIAAARKDQPVQPVEDGFGQASRVVRGKNRPVGQDRRLIGRKQHRRRAQRRQRVEIVDRVLLHPLRAAVLRCNTDDRSGLHGRSP